MDSKERDYLDLKEAHTDLRKQLKNQELKFSSEHQRLLSVQNQLNRSEQQSQQLWQCRKEQEEAFNKQVDQIVKFRDLCR